MPPPAVQLKRIALALGLPDTKAEPRVHASVRTADDAMKEALSAGFPVMEGRPDDPLLDFLDL